MLFLKDMKPLVVTFLHLAILINSVAFVHAQTRQRDPKRSQSRALPKPDDSQKRDVDEVLRVTTNLVTIPVSVKSHDGTYLFDLRKEQFRIYEDGVEQEIGHFSSVEQPFYVVLLIDTSSSTEANLGEIKEAVHAFIAQLRQRDAVLPVLFAGQLIPLLAKATSNRTVLREGVEKAHTDAGNNGTRLYDAVDFAYQALQSIPGRKAIIMFTDGDDTWSSATMRTTLCKAPEADAVIYPIQYGSSASTNYLKALASETGGRFYQADDNDTIKRSFAAVAEELRRQYNVGYYPKTTSPHPQAMTIRVELDRPNAAVIARKTLNVRR
jgi:Ca-activated chloride channel family protein